MFLPSAFEIKDVKLINEWLELFSFATLVSSNSNQISATHLPLLLSTDKSKLIGHMAKNNDQWKDSSGDQVLAIFQGPHHYISPSWYETMHAVPTWNYISVHVYGKFQLIDSEEYLINSLEALTNKYENNESKYKLSLVDQNYLMNLRKAIVGFEIQIQKIEAKAKLSQNHSQIRQNLVMDELKKLQNENALAISQWMSKILNFK